MIFSLVVLFIAAINSLFAQYSGHTLSQYPEEWTARRVPHPEVDSIMRVHTVGGAIDPQALGMTFTHEHLMSNFGKAIAEAAEYDTARLFEQVIPYLKRVQSLGVETIVDCTTAHFGRRVDLLRRLSEASGIRIITNTGFYGAAGDRYIPAFAYDLSAVAIADIWVGEYENGIAGTDVRPGFVKLAFDDGQPPSAIDQKLFEAGVLTHLRTGLPLAVHTGANEAAVSFQRERLAAHGVHPRHWIWTHANKMTDDGPLLELAAAGAWISLDGVKAGNIAEYVRRISLFKRNGFLDRLLLSHDGNGFPAGGDIRPFEAILTQLVPALREDGFTEEEIRQLMVDNPRAAFTVGR